MAYIERKCHRHCSRYICQEYMVNSSHRCFLACLGRKERNRSSKCCLKRRYCSSECYTGCSCHWPGCTLRNIVSICLRNSPDIGWLRLRPRLVGLRCKGLSSTGPRTRRIQCCTSSKFRCYRSWNRIGSLCSLSYRSCYNTYTHWQRHSIQVYTQQHIHYKSHWNFHIHSNWTRNKSDNILPCSTCIQPNTNCMSC